MTTRALAAKAAAERSCALLPGGSTEPHGPHLPLDTDVVISDVACDRAAPRLEAAGVSTVVAPAIPYGVTDYAAGFAGAIGVPASVLSPMIRAVVERLLADGFRHVCVVNNHLEPAHDAAVRAAIEGLPSGAASIACPLTRRWGRTLSAEFKSGACHAGRYETSLVLAADVAVRASYKDLPTLGASLSDGIRAGKHTFAEIGMPDAYTGAPAEATSAEGDELYGKLVEMIVAEVLEGLEARAGAAR